MIYFGILFLLSILIFNEDIYAYSLHDIKYILIFPSIGCRFFFPCVAMQIKDVYFVKDAH